MHTVGLSNAGAGRMSGAESKLDPAELLQRVAVDRDRTALAALFDAFGPRLKSMLMRLGADSASAEDLVQETFVSVWRKAHLYSPGRGAPSTWIFTIARNLRIDLLRRQSSKPYIDFETVEMASDTPIGSVVAEQRQIVARVTRALEALPEEQREVVRLSFVQELPHSEIAKRVGIPLGTVKSRLRLAYDRLRPQLEDLH
jgi:RNA polymerase sigma-70 factor (ECF subfamily)